MGQPKTDQGATPGAPPRPLANKSRDESTQPMANPDSIVLLTRAIDICSSVITLELGHRTLQDEARELIGLLAQFKPFIPEPGTRCGCGSGAVRLRDGQSFCYSCWIALPQLYRFGPSTAKDAGNTLLRPARQPKRLGQPK
jgi:hypothetical protein